MHSLFAPEHLFVGFTVVGATFVLTAYRFTLTQPRIYSLVYRRRTFRPTQGLCLPKQQPAFAYFVSMPLIYVLAGKIWAFSALLNGTSRPKAYIEIHCTAASPICAPQLFISAYSGLCIEKSLFHQPSRYAGVLLMVCPYATNLGGPHAFSISPPPPLASPKTTLKLLYQSYGRSCSLRLSRI